MKDSQRKSDITKIGDKYIKANNERFSTSDGADAHPA